MKLLKMCLDKTDNITMSVYQVDDKVCLRKSCGGSEEMYRQYTKLTDAFKAFDKEVLKDYRERGVYYGDFYSGDE